MDHSCNRDMRGTDGKYDPAGVWSEGESVKKTSFLKQLVDAGDAAKQLSDWKRIMQEHRRVRSFVESLKPGTTVGEVMEMEAGDADPQVRR